MWCFYAVLGIWAIDLVAITSASRTAFLEIVICENTAKDSPVYSYKLQGTFANIGSLKNAQGNVLQIHPFGLCNISNDDALYEKKWVGVVKLTVPSRESPACNGTVQKALGAVSKGAKAVIFDITDSPGAADELNAETALIKHPVVIINGSAAQKLMRIVNRQNVLKAKISCQPDTDQTKDSSSEYLDMVIFMTCFVLITLTCFMLLLKIKWKQTKKETSLAKMAFHAVSKMESKKFKEKSTGVEPVKTIKEKKWEQTLSIHSCSVMGISCVICLEEFHEGQEIRVVSCGHEFHLKCVDPWLLTNYTCPLCMLNIVEREGKGIKTESRCTPSFRSLFRCCFAANPLSSSSMVYSITQEDMPTDGLSFISNDATGVESLQFNPTSANSSHDLWDEHLVTNIALQETQHYRLPHSIMAEADPNTAASVSSLVENNKNIPELVSVNRPLSLSVQAWVPGSQQTNCWQKHLSQNRKSAVQIADIGTRKSYVEIGDAV